ncbi:translation initiation factor IF-2-like [Falco biarmicus]|uniref:translation initiation factor IF-2-like n=1 Tax=Falco biarmicus TaxID=345155 RepID=UPI0024BCABCE|nr:translation initiation factor IF-2-like [Falco biarmicus]
MSPVRPRVVRPFPPPSPARLPRGCGAPRDPAAVFAGEGPRSPARRSSSARHTCGPGPRARSHAKTSNNVNSSNNKYVRDQGCATESEVSWGNSGMWEQPRGKTAERPASRRPGWLRGPVPRPRDAHPPGDPPTDGGTYRQSGTRAGAAGRFQQHI